VVTCHPDFKALRANAAAVDSTRPLTPDGVITLVGFTGTLTQSDLAGLLA
jgi:hypothetical protein